MYFSLNYNIDFHVLPYLRPTLYIVKISKVLLSFIFFGMVISVYLHHTCNCVIQSFSLSDPVPAPFGPEKRESSVFLY